ncbi:hypothetical protein [Vibrio sp. HN007]|uniref:hypothetical protein n=1 Tax=Vibrio iocasae TaxID=3098914 RepID=UPI0035D50216
MSIERRWEEWLDSDPFSGAPDTSKPYKVKPNSAVPEPFKGAKAEEFVELTGNSDKLAKWLRSVTE